MAAVRYRSEWTDNNGDDWRIDIIDQGYSGSIQQNYILQADGCNLNWAGQTKTKFSPILTSELTIGLIIRDAGEQALLTLLASHPEGEFLVGLYKESSGTYNLWWSGVIMTDQIQFTESAYPRQVELTATDDLGNLTGLPYDNNGTAYSGAQSTVIGNMRLALQKTRQASFFYGNDDAFIYYANDFTPNNEDASVLNHLDSAKIPWSTFQIPQQTGLIKTVSTYQVLESICISYNARLFQYQGTWFMLPLGGYLDEDNGWGYKIMDYDGGSGGAISGVAKSRVLETDYKALADMTIAYFQPFRQTIRRQLYYGAAPLMWDAVYPLRTSPTVVDQDLDYAQNFQLRITSAARTVKLPQGSASGGDRVGRFLFKITVKVGDLYAHRAATFSNQGAFFTDWNSGFQYSYETPSFDDFTWSTNVGQIWVVSDTFNVFNGTGQNFLTHIDVSTAGLTADKEEAEMSCQVHFLDRNGNLTLLDNSNATGLGYTFLNLYSFAARNSGEDGLLSDGVQWSSEGNASNRGDLNTGEVIFGDLVSDGARGVIQVQTGATSYAASSGWRNNQHTTGTLGIHQLGTQELQKIHDQVGTGMSGSVVGQMPSPTELIQTSEGDKHLVIGLQANLTKGITEIECTRLIRGGTIIVGTGDDFTVAVDDGGWGTDVDDNGGTEPPIGFEGEQVLSVNGGKGTVVLTPDSFDDASTTNKFSTQDQLDAIASNTTNITGVAGIAAANVTAIALNTSKVGITTQQASEILINTAKQGTTLAERQKLAAINYANNAISGFSFGSNTNVISAEAIETDTDRQFVSSTQAANIAASKTKTDLISVSNGVINGLTLEDSTIDVEKINPSQSKTFVTAQEQGQISTNATNASSAVTTANAADTKATAAKTKTDLISTDSEGISGFIIGDGVTVLSTDQVTEDAGRKFVSATNESKLDKITFTQAPPNFPFNVDTERGNIKSAKDKTDLITVTGTAPNDKITGLATTNGSFNVEDGRQKMGHLTSNANGITAIQVAAGTSISLGDAAAFFAGDSGGAENRSGVTGDAVALIQNDGGLGEVADGTAGQFLQTNGSGVLSFATASGGGGGWHGNTTLMRVMPTEFVGNDLGRAQVHVRIEDDTSGKLGAAIDQATGSLFAINEIPVGYKATHVRVNASSTVTNAVEVIEYDTADGDITANTTGNTNTVLDITDISTSTTNAICIKVTPGSATVLIYSADITIATI